MGSSIVDLSSAFRECSNLRFLNLSSFKTGFCNNFDYMMYDSYKVETLDLGENFVMMPGASHNEPFRGLDLMRKEGIVFKNAQNRENFFSEKAEYLEYLLNGVPEGDLVLYGGTINTTRVLNYNSYRNVVMHLVESVTYETSAEHAIANNGTGTLTIRADYESGG